MERVNQHADGGPYGNSVQNLDGGVEVTRTIEDEGYVNEAQWMVVRYLEFEGGAAVGSRDRRVEPSVVKEYMYLES